MIMPVSGEGTEMKAWGCNDASNYSYYGDGAQ